MKVLLAGGGFVGCGIANELVRIGHEVTVLSPNRRAHLAPQVSFVSGRLELGVDLDDHLRDCDVAIDAASSMIPVSAQQSPASSLTAAVASTSWLAERAAVHGVRKHIFVSSGGTVYGEAPHGTPHRESDPLEPASTYGALKAAGEMAVRGCTVNTETAAVQLRLSNVYGPGQNMGRPQGIVGVALSNHVAGRVTRLFGPDEIVRDLIYIDDVARCVSLLIESDVVGPINLGSGVGIRLDMLVQLMSETVGADLLVEALVRRPFDVVHSVLDIGRARALGWDAQVTLREGLSETWRWIKGGGTR